jgi:hypothetical protein
LSVELFTLSHQLWKELKIRRDSEDLPFAASRTVTKDIEKLQHWMRESTAAESRAAAARVETAGTRAVK